VRGAGAGGGAWRGGGKPFPIPRSWGGTPASRGVPERGGVWGAISGPPIFLDFEPEHLRRVLRGDLPDDLVRHPGKDAIQELSRLRPGRLGVREVAPPEHVVDADLLSHLDAQIILHELHEHVAAPLVTR